MFDLTNRAESVGVTKVTKMGNMRTKCTMVV